MPDPEVATSTRWPPGEYVVVTNSAEVASATAAEVAGRMKPWAVAILLVLLLLALCALSCAISLHGQETQTQRLRTFLEANGVQVPEEDG